MRSLAFIVALVALTPAALAWEGRLVDAEGAPVRGARVTPVGEGSGVLTGRDGLFRLPGPVSDYEAVVVESADGTIAVLDVPRGGAGIVEIVLDDARIVTVTATLPAASGVRSPPGAPVATLPAAELRARTDASVQQLIGSLPAASAPSADADRPPALRGLTLGRTLFLLDGAPLATERRAGASGGPLEASSRDSLSVVRGPASVAYGSAAMGGVLLVTSPWAAPGSPARWDASVEGRFGGAPAAAASMRYQEDGWTLHGGLRRASDPEAADGTPLEGEARQRSVFAGRRWLAGRSLVSIGVRSDRLADAERLSRRDDPGPVVPEETSDRITIAVERPGRTEKTLLAWWAGGERTLERAVRPSDGRLAATTRLRDFGVRAAARRSGERWSWTAGLEARRRDDVRTSLAGTGVDLTALPPPFDAGALPLDDGRQQSVAGFATATWRITPRSRIDAGGRVEPISTRALSGGVPRRSSTTDTAAGLAWTLDAGNAGSLTARAARAFREPTISERYYRGLTGRGFVLDNPGLGTEVSRQVDVTWRLASAARVVELGVFDIEIEDVVVRERIDDPAAAALGLDLFRFENVGTARLQGVEASASWSLGGAGSLRVGAHHLRGEDGAGRPLDGVPGDALRAAWTAPLPDGWRARVAAAFEARDVRPGPGESVVPGHVRIDLDGTVPLSARVSLRLGVRNALDARFRDGARDDAPDAPGRTAVVGLAFRSGR